MDELAPALDEPAPGAPDAPAAPVAPVAPGPPPEVVCPISGEVMRDPVVTCDGHTYERIQIEAWLFERGHDTSPNTGMVLQDRSLVPNIALRWIAEQYL